MTRSFPRPTFLAAVAVVLAGMSSPAAAQFTATVTRPPARGATRPAAVAVEPTARDTMRPTVLSDIKAWVDSAAAALKAPAPTPGPRDSTAATAPQSPPSPPGTSRPRRSPR